MRIGICGGTFDPFHRGHLDPVLAARSTMTWDRIIYVPAWRQPFKTGYTTVAGPHRFAMVAMSIRDHDVLYASPVELERGGTSYSVDTLEALHREHPAAEFDWIIGDDNLAGLERWKEPEKLFTLARFVVLTRYAPPPPLHGTFSPQGGTKDLDGGVPASALGSREQGEGGPRPGERPFLERHIAAGNIVFAENKTVPISSTEIRNLVRAGEPIDTLVDPLVSRYIHHYGLYKEGQP